MASDDKEVRGTSTTRRTACDERKRKRGQVRMCFWIDAAGAEAVELLAKANGGDRGAVMSVAARYLVGLAKTGVKSVEL